VELPFQLGESGYLRGGAAPGGGRADLPGWCPTWTARRSLRRWCRRRSAIPTWCSAARAWRPESTSSRGRQAVCRWAGGRDVRLRLPYPPPIGKMKGVIEAESLSAKVTGKDAALVVQTDRELPDKAVRSSRLIRRRGAHRGGVERRRAAPLQPGPGRRQPRPGPPGEGSGRLRPGGLVHQGSTTAPATCCSDGTRLDTVSTSRPPTRSATACRWARTTWHRAASPGAARGGRSGEAGEVRGIGLDYVVLAASNGAQEAEFMRGPPNAVTKLRFGTEPALVGRRLRAGAGRDGRGRRRSSCSRARGPGAIGSRSRRRASPAAASSR